MIAPFELATPRAVVFGRGVRHELPARAAALGRRALWVTGSRPERHAELRAALERAGVALTSITVQGEPTTTVAESALAAARVFGVELVIAVGGGSVIDLGKAVAALLTNAGAPLDYLEVVGRGRALAAPSAPFIAVPTTAGTGAEVTRNAVLAVPGERVKVSLRSPHMLPSVALVDPELTVGLPKEITASTGLDALTQLLEPFVSVSPNPLTDGFCRDGLPRAARALRRACADGSDVAAREDMALASLLGGLALANAKLGAVHGLAGPIGGAFDAPHGAVCARLLPLVVRTNLAALRARAPASPSLPRFDEVARLLTGDPRASADDGAAWLERLVDDLHVPALCSYGVSTAAVTDLTRRGAAASSMKGNPLELRPDELETILVDAMQPRRS